MNVQGVRTRRTGAFDLQPFGVPFAAALAVAFPVAVDVAVAVAVVAPRRRAVGTVAALQTVAAGFTLALLFKDGTGWLFFPAETSSAAAACFARALSTRW